MICLLRLIWASSSLISMISYVVLQNSVVKVIRMGINKDIEGKAVDREYFAKVQRTKTGMLLGACVAIAADDLAPYVTSETVKAKIVTRPGKDCLIIEVTPVMLTAKQAPHKVDMAMCKTESAPDAMDGLRAIPAFVDYARRELANDRDFWEREAKFGTGIMQAAAIGVCTIGEE